MSSRRAAASAGVVIAAAGVVLGSAIARRAKTLSLLAPELRSSRLWLQPSVGGRPTLLAGRAMLDRRTEPVAGISVSLHSVAGGAGAFVYELPQRARPSAALVWIHGGGLILGRPEIDHEFCSRIARDLGILVVSVRYRLAPEHPFPAGFNDCFAGLRWVHDNASMLGVDPDRVAVGGMSAGGGLAAAVAQRAHDEGVPLAFQALVYPMLDDRTTQRADLNARGWVGWTPRSNAYGWRSYLSAEPGGAQTPPYAVPARRADLSGLAPAWIGVGEQDLFFDEDLDYANRLQAAGVTVQQLVEPGMYHGADVELPDVPSMRAFQQSMLDALGTALGLPL